MDRPAMGCGILDLPTGNQICGGMRLMCQTRDLRAAAWLLQGHRLSYNFVPSY